MTDIYCTNITSLSNTLLFSRPRKPVIIVLLMWTSTVSALTPEPQHALDNQVTQPPMPIKSIPTETNSPSSDSKDSKFADDLAQIQRDNALLEQLEKKAKLTESIGNYSKTTYIVNEAKSDAPDTTFNELAILSIYGVGQSFMAVIYYRGAEITVKPGTDIAGKWKVSSINASTVHIRNGKAEKVLSLSATTQPPLPTPSPAPVFPGTNPRQSYHGQ